MAEVWEVGRWILLAGTIGGFVHALKHDGLVLPVIAKLEKGGRAITLGFPGALIVSALAAAVSWALYGTASLSVVVGGTDPVELQLTLGALAAAALIGYGGSRWWGLNAERQIKTDLARHASVRPEVAEPAPKMEFDAKAGPAVRGLPKTAEFDAKAGPAVGVLPEVTTAAELADLTGPKLAKRYNELTGR